MPFKSHLLFEDPALQYFSELVMVWLVVPSLLVSVNLVGAGSAAGVAATVGTGSEAVGVGVTAVGAATAVVVATGAGVS